MSDSKLILGSCIKTLQNISRCTVLWTSNSNLILGSCIKTLFRIYHDARPSERQTQIWYWGVALKPFNFIQICFKIGQKLPGTLHKDLSTFYWCRRQNRHKISLFEWKSMRLLGQPRRYKHYANAPECYVIRTQHIRLLHSTTRLPGSSVRIPLEAHIKLVSVIS